MRDVCVDIFVLEFDLDNLKQRQGDKRELHDRDQTHKSSSALGRNNMQSGTYWLGVCRSFNRLNTLVFSGHHPLSPLCYDGKDMTVAETVLGSISQIFAGADLRSEVFENTKTRVEEDKEVCGSRLLSGR